MQSEKIKNELLKSSIIGGLINGIINGVTNWFEVKGKTSILLTQNVISSTEETVFSLAVPLAVSLAFMGTSIAYLTLKFKNKPPYFPTVFLTGLKHAFFVFGVVVAFAVLIQRFAGSISTTPLGSAIVVGVVAAIIAMVVNYLTVTAIIAKGQNLK
jgi:hypothetical protein